MAELYHLNIRGLKIFNSDKINKVCYILEKVSQVLFLNIQETHLRDNSEIPRKFEVTEAFDSWISYASIMASCVTTELDLRIAAYLNPASTVKTTPDSLTFVGIVTPALEETVEILSIE